jgi:hypothetical protein
MNHAAPDELWKAIRDDHAAGTPGGAALTGLPGGYVDQVARRAEFEQGRPDAVFSHDAPYWTGRLTVCRKRMEVTRTDLRLLLDGLDALAALDAAAAAVEREFPGWRLWLSSTDRWWATRWGASAADARGRGLPLTVDADDLAGLRAELVAAQEADPAPTGARR